MIIPGNDNLQIGMSGSRILYGLDWKDNWILVLSLP